MYSVVIVTYVKRFDEWLKPLLAEVKRQRPDVEVILAVNGEKNYFNEDYRRELLGLVAEYPNVYPTIYPRFRSLSRLWNLAVQSATHNRVLVLSDDLTLEDGFFNEYEEGMQGKTCFTINQSFSAFSVTKDELIALNWFDERLLGIGWEDGDFMKRYKQYFQLPEFPNLHTEWCKNIVDPRFYKVHSEKLAEYIRTEKPEDRIEGQIRDQESGRYSEFNRLVSLDNPQTQYPYESFYHHNKHLL